MIAMCFPVGQLIKGSVVNGLLLEGAYLVLIREIPSLLPKLEKDILSYVGRESLIIDITICEYAQWSIISGEDIMKLIVFHRSSHGMQR